MRRWNRIFDSGAGKVEVRKVEVVDSDAFAKLANLRHQLKAAEKADSVEGGILALKQTRETVIAAIQAFQHSRYALGRALCAYRSYFKAEGSWTQAVKIIAENIGVGERTVYRLMEGYESASRLPQTMLEVLEEQKIDPAAGKNSDLVDNLLEMPAPKTREEAASAVKAASQSHLEKKRAAKKAIAKLSQRDGLDQFAHRILKQFGERYRSVKAERRDEEVRYILELVVNTLRSDIRELRQYGRPALVPKPTMKEAA